MIIKDDVIFGLTPEEVEDRIQKGQVNKKENRKTKTYREIFLNNLLSVFNLVILVMAILVLPTIKRIGDLSNIVFVAIALLNLLIGIVQEIKAKRIVDKLVLVNSEKVKVLRNLSTEFISINEIVLDDVVIYYTYTTDGTEPADPTVAGATMNSGSSAVYTLLKREGLAEGGAVAGFGK